MIQNILDSDLREGTNMMRKYYESLARTAISESERLEFSREADDYRYLEEIYGGRN